MAKNESDENPVLAVLAQRLAPKPRVSVMRRYDAMVRELAYLNEKREQNLVFIRRRKWSDVRLCSLFAVNSVYQEILGPLQASARESLSGLGRDLPILHGSQRFDSAHAARVNAALDGFFLLVSELGFQRQWMSKNTCGDLIYFIARHEREVAPPDDPDPA